MKTQKLYITQYILVGFLIINELNLVQSSSNCSYGYNGLYCDECGKTYAQQNLIVGGITAKAQSWPSIAYVIFNYKLDLVTNFGTIPYSISYSCGGTLIDRSTVLTAGHCIITKDEYKYYGTTYKFNVVPNKYYPTFGSMYTVYLGLQDKSLIYGWDISPAVKMSVSGVKLHENFQSTSQVIYNDIALLRLSKEVTLNEYIQLACLPTKNTDTSNGISGYVAGWGTTSFGGSTPNQLRNVKITVYDNSKCPFKLNSNQICAGELAGGKDTCQGDSGGPLYVQTTVNSVTKFVLVGITSFGDGCAKVNSPGVYTRVSSFLDWIDANSNSSISKDTSEGSNNSGSKSFHLNENIYSYFIFNNFLILVLNFIFY